MRSLRTPLWLGLLLGLAACSRPGTLKVKVTGVPDGAMSLAVSLAQADPGAEPVLPEQGLTPYALPQPVVGQTSFVLRLPLASDTTLLLGVAAFSQAGGSGCLLGLGSAAHPYRKEILDDEMEVALSPSQDDPQKGCAGAARIVAVLPSALTVAGGETLQVQGWGFVPGAKIVLNGQPLETRYVSGGQLEATTPPSARLMPVPLSITFPGELPGAASLSYSGLRYVAKAIAFTPLTTFAVPDDYHKLAVADLDGDKRPDLLFYPSRDTSDNQVSVAFQRAPLQFTREPLTLSGGTLGAVDEIRAVDLDRDGDIDLVALSSTRQSLNLLVNDGRGSFSLTTQPLGATATSFLCADLNADGAPELLFLDNGRNANQLLYVLTNDGKGNLDSVPASRTKLQQTQGDYASLISLDYDLDGRNDLLVLDNDKFSVILNRGAGLPADDSAAPLIQFSNSISSYLSIADLDGDQIPDLLASDLGSIPMVFLSRSTPPRALQGLRPACPSAIYTAGDLDGDGLPETAFGCSYRPEIRFQRQLPNHQLIASSQAPPVAYKGSDLYVYDVQLVDLDADGRPELIFATTPNYSNDATEYYVHRNVSQ